MYTKLVRAVSTASTAPIFGLRHLLMPNALVYGYKHVVPREFRRIMVFLGMSDVLSAADKVGTHSSLKQDPLAN